MEDESWVLNQKENIIYRKMGRSLAILSEKRNPFCKTDTKAGSFLNKLQSLCYKLKSVMNHVKYQSW